MGGLGALSVKVGRGGPGWTIGGCGSRRALIMGRESGVDSGRGGIGVGCVGAGWGGGGGGDEEMGNEVVN